MDFKDRISARPNRIKLTDENGVRRYYTMERADEPTQVGTPLNASNLNQLMQRYVIKLVKNADNTYKMTSINDDDLSFNEVYNITRKLNEYVVVVYGNSKLRPQYVSTNEMMFIGVDRSTESKILRILYTPTRLTYETFVVAEKRYVDEKIGDIDFTSLMPKSGGTFTGMVTMGYGNHDTQSLYNMEIKTTSGGSRAKTSLITFVRK